MENDLIRRSDAVAICCDLFCGSSCKPDERDTCVLVEAVQANIPAVDAVEVVHSHWEDVEVEDVGELTPLYIQSIASMCCASCNRYHNEVYHYGNPTEMAHYCPHCGARMDGEDGDA